MAAKIGLGLRNALQLVEVGYFDEFPFAIEVAISISFLFQGCIFMWKLLEVFKGCHK